MRTRTAAIVAGAALTALTVSAPADMVVLDIQELTTGYSNTLNLNGNPTGDPLVENHVGAVLETDFSINWDFDSRNDTSPFGQLGSNFTVESKSAASLQFVISLTLMMDSGASPDTMYSGSSSWSLTGTDGSLSSLGGSPMWEAFLDGGSIDSIYPDPTAIGFSGVGSDDLSAPPVGGTTGGFASTMGIVLSFELSSLDTVITTGVLNVAPIPAPAALALLAVGGICTGRRRRN